MVRSETGVVPDVNEVPEPGVMLSMDYQTNIYEYLRWMDDQLVGALAQVHNDAFNDEDFGSLESSHAELLTLKRVRDKAYKLLDYPKFGIPPSSTPSSS